MTHKKLHLEEKICAHCERPFCWRRKWARDWDNVKYCSQRCKRSARPANQMTKLAANSPQYTTPNLCAAGSVEDEF
ncbi:MAG: DUF2256 domain-containing protein [Thalassolituus sp.]